MSTVLDQVQGVGLPLPVDHPGAGRRPAVDDHTRAEWAEFGRRIDRAGDGLLGGHVGTDEPDRVTHFPDQQLSSLLRQASDDDTGARSTSRRVVAGPKPPLHRSRRPSPVTSGCHPPSVQST
jgi:hypothetical protein